MTDRLAQIQARSDVANDYPGAVTIEQSQADVPDLLAMVRERDVRLDALLRLCDTAEKYGTYHVIQASTIRAAITATEGAETSHVQCEDCGKCRVTPREEWCGHCEYFSCERGADCAATEGAE